MPHFTAKVLDDRRLELPQGALSLIRPGQEIEIELEEATSPIPNERVIAMLRDLEAMKKGMPESDPADTNRLIREGRAGAIYGDTVGE